MQRLYLLLLDSAREGFDIQAGKVVEILGVGNQRSSGNWNLTKHQIAELAQNISADQLKVTAHVYLGLDWEAVDNLEWEHRGDQIPFKCSLIRRWLQLNPGSDSAEVRLFFCINYTTNTYFWL